MVDVEIRQATSVDVAALYEGPQKRSMRALVITIDGIPKGLGGIYYEEDKIIAFARIGPELRKFPFAIYKAGRMVLKMIERRSKIVYAVADPKTERSAEFLEHLGFLKMGEVYQWTSEQARTF